MKPPFAYQERSEALRLEAALLIYGGRYVTKHAVAHVPGRAPQLGAGVPLSRGELAKLLAAAGQDAGMSGWVDPRVLYVGPDLIVWYSPPAIRTVFFAKMDGKDAGTLSGATGRAAQPALVWAVKGSRWYVWAVRRTGARFDADTPLFQAPYLNVYENGEICTGNAAVPRQLSTDVINGFERAFFESRFTHPNANELTRYEGGIYALWRHLLAAGVADPRFPEDSLVPLNATLGDVVRRLSKES